MTWVGLVFLFCFLFSHPFVSKKGEVGVLGFGIGSVECELGWGCGMRWFREI